MDAWVGEEFWKCFNGQWRGEAGPDLKHYKLSSETSPKIGFKWCASSSHWHTFDTLEAHKYESLRVSRSQSLKVSKSGCQDPKLSSCFSLKGLRVLGSQGIVAVDIVGTVEAIWIYQALIRAISKILLTHSPLWILVLDWEVQAHVKKRLFWSAPHFLTFWSSTGVPVWERR